MHEGCLEGMKTTLFFLLLLCALAWNAAAGEINGLITVSKPLTKQRMAISAYQPRGVFVPASGAAKPAGEEFHRMVIYLEGKALPGGQPIEAELRQEKRQFSEEVMAVPVGSTVAFPNGDPIFHNVYSLSKAKQFDLGYYPLNQSKSVKFTRPGVVQVYCHIHREMNAAVVVVPSSWYGQPDNGGHFHLTGIPAGSYELVVWHKTVGFLRRSVNIPAEGAVNVTLDVPALENDAPADPADSSEGEPGSNDAIR